MGDSGPSLAASLPAHLICCIFAAVDKQAYGGMQTVLSFEERARAETVCKNWQAALASHPGTYTSLDIDTCQPRGSLINQNATQPVEAVLQAATAKAAGRVQALAARPPAVGSVELSIGDPSTEHHTNAYVAALEALLSRQGAGRKLCIRVSDDASSLPFWLSKAAQYPSMERLMVQNNYNGYHVTLAPDLPLHSLPHLRALLLEPGAHGILELSLPMPFLESLEVPSDDMGLGPLPAALVTIRRPSAAATPAGRRASRQGNAGGAAGAAAIPPPPFPSLRHIEVAAASFEMDAAAVPALAELSLDLFFPDSRLVISNASALQALSKLELSSCTIYNSSVLAEMPGAGDTLDTAVHSNVFVPLLGSPLPALRHLSLTICEPVSTAMGRVIRQLTALTALHLRFPYPETKYRNKENDEDQDEEEEALVAGGTAAVFDCQLLEAMANLQELAASHCTRLVNPTALAQLATLHTFCCGHGGNIAGLPALAPHLTHLTCLDMPDISASQLAAKEAVCAALAHMRGLRCLMLGALEHAWNRANFEAAQQKHGQAVQAIRGLLPEGCELQAAEPLCR